VVIDTPAGESALSLGGHARADTLITPLNDSFVDLDVLARIDPDTHQILRPSRYAAMVWEMKKERARRDGRSIDWVVLRNRLANLDAHNKRAMAATLAALGKRIGFRVAPGVSERVIYRELFLVGLTLLDLREGETGVHLSLSHIAARRELRDLLDALDLARRPRRAAARAGGADPAAPAA
jgi:chromosome partitioning protein